jgi:ankyrin repeat protein
LFKNAQSSKLGEMRNILRDDNVGIADYRRGHSEKPIATTLTAYLEACKKGQKDALPGTQLLVQHGANASIELDNGDSAMSMAVKYDSVDVARYLIENGGKIKVYSFKSVEMIKLFTANGFDIHSRTPRGLTLLQQVTESNKNASKLRHFLVAHGCDIDELSNAGETALQRSVNRHNIETTTELCHLGANLHITNGEGKTPLDVAINLYRMAEDDMESPGISLTKWNASKNTFQPMIQICKDEKEAIIRILQEEPARRKTIDYLYAVLCDYDFFRNSRVDDTGTPNSGIAALGLDPHDFILRQLGIQRS